MPPRLRLALLLVLALCAGLLTVATPAVAAGQPRGKVVFPSNRLTVRDRTQLTGRRLNLPLPNCDRQPSGCNEVRLLNQLDGFDIDPRIEVQLTGAPDLDSLRRWNFYVQRVDGGPRIKMNRLVYEPRTKKLYGHPRRQLREGTTYSAVWNGAGPAMRQRFTTLSATRGLVQMRRQLDNGSAYTAAGIPASGRGIDFAILPEGERAVFDAPEVLEMTRHNDRFKGEELVDERIINTAEAGARYYAFGSINSPQWITGNRFIPQTRTRAGAPKVRGAEKVGVTLIVPAGAPPEGGWPTAIFGPGITRSKYDVFLAADANASRGIATLSLDPVGHAYGPRGEVTVRTLSGGETRFSMFGRGKVTNAEGEYDAISNVGAPQQPHRLAMVALRDGLRQTAADVMALVRAVERGVDVDGDGTVDLRPDNVGLYAQSLGGIYGTMVSAVDPQVEVAVLNVPGGPIAEIARLAPGFRPNVASALGLRRPSLLNGGLDCFTESVPLWNEDPVTKPARGATTIQRYASRTNWFNRPGSPEAFSPKLRKEPLGPQKRVLYQFALGDATVPNPTSAMLMRAGHLGPKTAFYRNDRTPTRDRNPHGFLLDPTISGRNQAQAQVVEFIASNGETVLDPDGAGPVWEVPISDKPTLEQLNYDFRGQIEAREQYAGPGCPGAGS